MNHQPPSFTDTGRKELVPERRPLANFIKGLPMLIAALANTAGAADYSVYRFLGRHGQSDGLEIRDRHPRVRGHRLHRVLVLWSRTVRRVEPLRAGDDGLLQGP